MSSIHSISPFSTIAATAGAPSPQKNGDFDSVLNNVGSEKASNTSKSNSISSNLLNINLLSLDSIYKDSNSSDGLGKLINGLLENIQVTLEGKLSGASFSANTSGFAFTDAFQSVFGTDGPLFNFIDRVTVELGLSTEQNLALQNIAINNKDATRSQESIDKIGKELREAGIV